MQSAISSRRPSPNRSASTMPARPSTSRTARASSASSSPILRGEGLHVAVRHEEAGLSVANGVTQAVGVGGHDWRPRRHSTRSPSAPSPSFSDGHTHTRASASSRSRSASLDEAGEAGAVGQPSSFASDLEPAPVPDPRPTMVISTSGKRSGRAAPWRGASRRPSCSSRDARDRSPCAAGPPWCRLRSSGRSMPGWLTTICSPGSPRRIRSDVASSRKSCKKGALAVDEAGSGARSLQTVAATGQGTCCERDLAEEVVAEREHRGARVDRRVEGNLVEALHHHVEVAAPGLASGAPEQRSGSSAGDPPMRRIVDVVDALRRRRRLRNPEAKWVTS